jgi:hypothetical protein
MRDSMPSKLARRFLLVLSLAAACSGRSDDRPPVATPSVAFSRPQAPLGSPVDVTYRFDVAPGAQIFRDYRVFVHFVDSEGDMMWTEDHDLPTPTSQWKPGQRVEYTRVMWVPVYPYIGDARVRIGLYVPGQDDRLPLIGREQGPHEYEVATLTLQPESEKVFLILKDGWHGIETAADNQSVEWQWTKKVATIAFRNPKRDVTFFLEAAGRADVFKPPQRVFIKVNDQVVHTLVMEGGLKLWRLPITAAQLGTADMVDLKIEVDRTFTPADIPAGAPGHGADTRTLGIRVTHTYVQ